jgi:hypothetical protein
MVCMDPFFNAMGNTVRPEACSAAAVAIGKRVDEPVENGGRE